ncbi:MAG: hypothetical protein AAF726_20790 [Planctomycetota bacterium]
MSDPYRDDERHSRDDAFTVDAPPGEHRVEVDALRESLARLLRRSPDEVVDELCAGRPIDLVAACEAHVADSAYFLEEGRVAAKVIARLASLAGSAAEVDLDAVVAEATAEAIEEGPIAVEAMRLIDDPLDDDPPVLVRLGRVFGLSMERVVGLVPRLNALGQEDRHVVFHCAIGGLTPEAYALRFDDDRRIVQAILDQVPRLA